MVTDLHWDSSGVLMTNNSTKSLQFLAMACYIFTKLIKPLVKCWRAEGLQAVVYLDDGIVAANGIEAAPHR